MVIDSSALIAILSDCFTYALAKFCDEPLLFQGNDFSQTDVQLV